MTSVLHRLRTGLEQLAGQHAVRRRRLLQGQQGVRIQLDGQHWLSFCSNDYLGLAAHPALIDAVTQGVAHMGVGAGASHLVGGHHVAHEAFEQAFATFVGLPSALMFSTGYMANLAVIGTLVGRTGAVFADRLNHASLNDAALLSRAKVYRYPHGDLKTLARQMAQSPCKDKLVAVDAVFSMDGDVADLPALLALCEQYDAWLLVDDAHGFGVMGVHGAGSLTHFQLQSSRIIYLATLGKAAGVFGAVVAGDVDVIAWLMQKARTYMYTTAVPPVLASALVVSVQLIRQADAARAHLFTLIHQLRVGLQQQGWRLAESSTPIQPVWVGSNTDVLALSQRLEQHGLLVPAIRPPTVPPGSARLRISLSAAHQAADVRQLLTAMGTFHG